MASVHPQTTLPPIFWYLLLLHLTQTWFPFLALFAWHLLTSVLDDNPFSFLSSWRFRFYGSHHTVCLGILGSVNILGPVSETETNMIFYKMPCKAIWNKSGRQRNFSKKKDIYTGQVVSVLLKRNQGILELLFLWSKQLEEKRVCLAHTSTTHFIIKGRQERNSSRVGMWRQKPWGYAAYWITSHCFPCLLPLKTQDYQPRSSPTHNGLGPPIVITDYENRLAYSPVL